MGKYLKEEQDFIQAIRSRKSTAWEQLYTEYYTSLCRYAMKILDDPEMATDIVQNVMVRLWENPPQLETVSLLRFYLYRAINNNCLQYIRNKNRDDKRLKEWIFYTEDIDSDSLTAVVTEEVLRKLHLLIDALPQKRREVILLSMKKMSNEEIGEAMHITVHTVKKHKKEAYAYIRQILGADMLCLLFSFFSKRDVLLN